MLKSFVILSDSKTLDCHFEPFAKKRLSGLQGVAVTKIHIVILSVSEISKEFKTRFEFTDTSPKAQYDKEIALYDKVY